MLKLFDHKAFDNLTRPESFTVGDTVATISSSWGGAGLYAERYQVGKSRLEKIFGLKVVETQHALASPEFLYNHPQQRAEDLLAAFNNPDIKAIFSNIGGEESIRMLPYIDFEAIRNNPKIFMGFSDSTVTHFICLKAGIRSYYGTSVLCGFAENVAMNSYEMRAIRKALFNKAHSYQLEHNLEGWTDERLEWDNPANQQIQRQLRAPTKYKFLGSQQISRGHLLGGCAEVLAILNGTPLWPELAQWNGAILFLETAGEYRHDHLKHLLRSLGAQGILASLNGILFSKPGGEISVKPTEWPLYDQAILAVLREYNCDIPVVSNMDFGHTAPMTVLPYGATTEINPQRQTITILD